MKHSLVFLLLLPLTIGTCERTLPADPNQVDAWIAQIVKPENRHLGVKVDTLTPEIRQKISQKATNELQTILVNCQCLAQRISEGKPATVFDALQFLLFTMQADGQAFASLLPLCKNAAANHNLTKEYKNFAIQVMEEKKCPIEAIIAVLNSHLYWGYSEDHNMAALCIEKGILPNFETIPVNRRSWLKKILSECTSDGTIYKKPTQSLIPAFTKLQKLLEQTPEYITP